MREINDKVFNENDSFSLKHPKNESHVKNDEKDLKLDGIFRDCIDFIKSHQENIQKSKVALQTIEGLAVLETQFDKLEKPTLARKVYQLTGMSIHADTNYPTLEIFKMAVLQAISCIKSTFLKSENETEKIRFFNHALDSPACFEFRIEHLIEYSNERNTLFGKLKAKIMDFNITNGRQRYTPVTLEELIDLLSNEDFFTKNKITVINLRENLSLLRELHLFGLLKRDPSLNEKDEKPPIEKINDAFALYEDIGKGREVFKDYLLENANLNDEEKKMIDKLIDEYLNLFPERKKFI